MTRISGLVCLFATFTGVHIHQPQSAQAARKPNVLFLFTDDQRPDTIAALGNPAIRTPNLDKLAASGMVFRNAYCMGSTIGAVCLPSRAMALSGRSLFRLKPNSRTAQYDVSFPLSMKAAGYVTYHHGKSGNTPHGIHKEFHHTKYVSDDDAERRSGRPGKEIADAAIAFLDDYDQDEPFFMYLAFANPHDPRAADPEYRSRYDDSRIPLPTNFLPMHPFDNGEMAVRDEQLAPWPRTEADVRKQLADYYAVITYLDMEIGRILDALKRTGGYDDTIIVFSSDHGLSMGSHGLMGKQNLYEHGMGAPLIFAGPGIPQGESTALVYLHDIYPTVCELVGAELPSLGGGSEGVSFASAVTGPGQSARESIFLAYKNVQRAIRVGDWKLIRYPLVDVNQLFNLKDDPDEITDLSTERPEVVERMTAVLRERQKAFGDPDPLFVEHPEDKAVRIDQLEEAKRIAVEKAKAAKARRNR